MDVLSEAMPNTEYPHLPPQNLEAEEALLGAMFMAPDKTLAVADAEGLRESDFYRPAHRTLYQIILYLHERGTVDELATVNELKARGLLKEVGGSAAVFSLAERVPAVANAKAYAAEVVDQARLRSLVETGHEIARLGYEHPDKVGKLVERAVTLTDTMARSCQRTQGNQASAEQLSEWLVKHTIGQIEPAERFAYPFPRLQAATGGFGRTEVVSIGGYSGDGKSAFKNQIVLGLPKGTRVGVFTLEMQEEEEQLRFASSLTGIESNRMWDPSLLNMEEQAQIVDAAADLGEYSYTIHAGIKPIQGIAAIQRREKYDVVIVDHFHLLPGSNKTETMADNANALKTIAMSTGCALINLFQLNRSEDRGFPVPTVNRVRGGNSLHDASNQMMFVYRERSSDGVYATNKSQLIMAKNRSGKSGFQIGCTFVPERIMFEEQAA